MEAHDVFTLRRVLVFRERRILRDMNPLAIPVRFAQREAECLLEVEEGSFTPSVCLGGDPVPKAIFTDRELLKSALPGRRVKVPHYPDLSVNQARRGTLTRFGRLRSLAVRHDADRPILGPGQIKTPDAGCVI